MAALASRAAGPVSRSHGLPQGSCSQRSEHLTWSSTRAAARKPALPLPHPHRSPLPAPGRCSQDLRPELLVTSGVGASGEPCLATSSSRSRDAVGPCASGEVRCRPATSSDLPTIRRLVLSEYMNPLSLDWRRFVVAEKREPGQGVPLAAAPDDGGNPPEEWRVVGVGQLKLYREPDAQGLGAEDPSPFLELRSLVVEPDFRGQGIGSQLVSLLLQRADGQMGPNVAVASESGMGTGVGAAFPVYLLTVGKRTSFYNRWGFKEVMDPKQVPEQLRLELGLGKIVARLTVGDRCLCMRLGP